MMKEFIVTAALATVLSIGMGCSTLPTRNSDSGIVGEYQLKNGSTLQVAKGASVNEFRISAVDLGEYRWTSIGFFNPECMCIDAVFQYNSHKEDYGDTVGVHRFTFQDNYNKVMKEGGWNELDQFPKQVYTRK